MAGMENLTGRILGEAEEAANRCRKQARQEAERIRQEGQRKAVRAAREIRRRLEAERGRQRRQNREDCEGQRRLRLLTARQQILQEMEEAAKTAFLQAGDRQYFSVMERLLEAEAWPGDGILCLAETDLARMPEEFPGRAAQIAREKGGTLTIRGEKALPAEGFVLIYGKVEINCTWSALARERRDQMRDAAARLLWEDIYE